MTVTYFGNGFYSGLSSDTKPAAAAGYRYYSTDTGDIEVSDGTYWWYISSFNPLSTKRWGSWGTGPLITTGQVTGVGLMVGSGFGASNTAVITDTTNGRYWANVTGTNAGDDAGGRIGSIQLTTRQHNPRMRFRFKFPAAGDHTLARMFFGFAASAAAPTGDDPLNAVAGIYVGFISGGTNFIVMRNDTSGATDLTGNVAASAQALDEAIHTVSLVADGPNNKFAVKWDNNAYVDFTTEIVTATNQFASSYYIENNDAGNAKTIQMYDIFMQADK